MRKITILLLLLCLPKLYSQTKPVITEILNVTGANNITQNGTAFGLTTTAGALTMDTLKFYVIYGGSGTTADSTKARLLVQSSILGRWSPGIQLDTLQAYGASNVEYSGDSLTKFLSVIKAVRADTIRADWYKNTALLGDATGKNFFNQRTDWKFRIVAQFGQAISSGFAPPVGFGSTLGKITVNQINWK